MNLLLGRVGLFLDLLLTISTTWVICQTAGGPIVDVAYLAELYEKVAPRSCNGSRRGQNTPESHLDSVTSAPGDNALYTL
jgi:hypothetical protein